MRPDPAGISQEGPEDAAVVARVLAGEPTLYAVLVERYQRRLWWSCRRMLDDPDEAEDVVQETFVRAYRHLADYDPARRFYTWLYAIARNRCLNVLRRRKVWGAVRLDAPGGDDPLAAGGGIEAALASSDPPSAEAERGELAAALAVCLETLPEEQRQCFELRHGEEFSYGEIAAVLGIPIGTVMSRLSRAREKMRSCLETRGIAGAQG